MPAESKIFDFCPWNHYSLGPCVCPWASSFC